MSLLKKKKSKDLHMRYIFLLVFLELIRINRRLDSCVQDLQKESCKQLGICVAYEVAVDELGRDDRR